MSVVRLPLCFLPFCFAFLVLAQPRLAHAQEATLLGRNVVTIRFEPEQQPVDAAELHGLLPLRIGQPLRLEEVRRSIEKLFATGRYTDIQVDVQPYQQGVLVRFLTANQWFIGDVSVNGAVSDPPSPAQLVTAARLDLGQLLTTGRLDAAVAGQRQVLESNGLFRGTIKPVFEYLNEYQQANLRFEIESGKRAIFAPPVVVGDAKLSPAKILESTNFRRWILGTWKPVTDTRMHDALEGIRKLYRRENRLQAQVTLEKLTYDPATNRATPTLRLEAGPRIEINPVGAKVKASRLQKLVPVFEEHSIDHDLLNEGARNLRDYFQAQGYFGAEVVAEEQRVVNDRARIDYLINTGARQRLVAIEIAGNNYFPTEAIRERMYLRTVSPMQFRRGRYSENLIAQDEEAITALYNSNGFQHAKVTHRLEPDYHGRKGDLAVSLNIEEGSQTLVGDVILEGVTAFDPKVIAAALSCVSGQPYSEGTVAVDRDAILERYYDAGYPNASFEWSQQAEPATNRVNLHLRVREGNRQFVRQVVVSRLDVTRPSLVFRNIPLVPGDPISPTRLAEIQRKLYDLGIFARVNAAIQDADGETSNKFVVFELEEARRYSVAFGFGAELGRIGGCQGCLQSAAGETGFSPRVSFDLTRTNLWGLAHTVSLRTRASRLDRRAQLTYAWSPLGTRSQWNVSLTGLYDDSQDVRTFSAVRQEGSLQLSQRASKADTLFYRYTFRHVLVNRDTLILTPSALPQLWQPVRLGLLGINLVDDRRDDPLDPRKGRYTTIDLGLAQRMVGSQRDFLRFLGRNASYHPLGSHLVLARSTQFGDIYAFRANSDVSNIVPLAERFFGGGGTSHRGFPENQAGPRDLNTGFPLGGTAEFFNQTELRFPLFGENVGGVIFHDMGNTFSSLRNISFRTSQKSLSDFNYTVHAAGFGIRYRTPVGPVRIDVSYSANPPRFFGFNGTYKELVEAGVNPCVNAPAKCVVQSVNKFQYFFSIGQTF
jgi:outer membrane protein insertion porin family